jgi:GMP synthase-like glutamine amidotransferase
MAVPICNTSTTESPLLKLIPADSQVWMSHGDTIATLAA